MNDYTLALPDEATWTSHQDQVQGAIDVIGEHNGKYLVNVRGAIPEELLPYHVAPAEPLRVWF